VAHSVAYDLPLRYKAARHAGEKQRIAASAAGLVAPGMVVGLTGGTTTTELARAIATRADLVTSADEPTLTVVTNALNIANELTVRRHVKIVLTGGVARPQSYELIGPLAMKVLEAISLDVAFVGVNGLDPDFGASAQHEGEANINHLLASRARQVVVVADASKLGRQAFARICTISEVDVLVTDDGAPDQVVRRFEEQGIEVRTV
jgi:DeoR family transcriptional regulator of aga operon